MAINNPGQLLGRLGFLLFRLQSRESDHAVIVPHHVPGHGKTDVGNGHTMSFPGLGSRPVPMARMEDDGRVTGSLAVAFAAT
jgi:hypothetical protein